MGRVGSPAKRYPFAGEGDDDDNVIGTTQQSTSTRGSPPSSRKPWGYLGSKNASPRTTTWTSSTAGGDAAVGAQRANAFQGAAVRLVLIGVSLAYLWAFSSLYVQIPGLWGNEGVLPVDSILLRDVPTLARCELVVHACTLRTEAYTHVKEHECFVVRAMLRT
jgi:hypothetical protein